MTVFCLLSQRILEEDEEKIEQERIKQTLDLQFHGHKQHQLFQSMEEQIDTAGAGTLPGQAILKPNAPPVQYAYKHPPPPEYYHEHPHGSGFEAQLNVHSGTDIGPAPDQHNDQLTPLPPRPKPRPPKPHPPKPGPTPPTMSPSDSEIHQLPPPHAGGPFAGSPFAGGPVAGGPVAGGPVAGGPLTGGSQRKLPSPLGAPGITPQAHRTYPPTPPARHWNEPHPLSSQYPPQYGTEIPHQKPIAKQRSVGGEIKQRTLMPQQGDRLQGSSEAQSSYQQQFRSLQEDQYQTGQYSLSMSAPLQIQPNPKQWEVYESPAYERHSRLDQDLESIIHEQAMAVETQVGGIDESSQLLTSEMRLL